MVELLKMNRMQKLEAQYNNLKAKAKELMKAGDLAHYITTIAEANKVKKMYLATAYSNY